MTTQSRMRHRIIAAVISTPAQFLEDLHHSREPAWPRCLLAALEVFYPLPELRLASRSHSNDFSPDRRGNQPRRRNYPTVVIARPAP
jgi:hypothetical protein